MPTLPKGVLTRLKAQTEAENPFDAAGAPVGIPTAAHPDANLLAGFVERTITGTERTQVLNHLTGCASCREVAAFALPEEVSEIPVGIPAGRGWSAIARWVSIATAPGVLTLILIAYLHSWNRQGGLSHLAMLPRLAGGVTIGPQHAGASTPSVQTSTPTPTTSPELQANRLAANPARAPKESEDYRRLAAPATRTPARTQVTVLASSQPPATLRARIVSAVAGGGTGAGRAAASAMENAGPRAASPAAGQAIPETGAGSAQASGADVAASGRSRSVVWRIAADGTAQRSLDGGRSFAPIAIAAGTRLQVVAAFGTSVWVGGADGILLHSADEGATWTQAANDFDGDAITSIQLRDAPRLTITTASGSRWVSEDGGQHWQRQP